MTIRDNIWGDSQNTLSVSIYRIIVVSIWYFFKNHDSDISNDKVNDAFHDDYIKYNEIISAKKIGKVIENVIKQSTVII